MNAITISNTRPGFVPFSMSPLRIAGQPSRQVRPPAYRPAPYKPPMLANPPVSPVMGQGFRFSELPLSLTLGVAGAAGLVLSGVVPSPVKELATVAGLGLIAFGIINLFSGTAAAETSTPATGSEPFKTADVSDFNKVTAKISKPSRNESVSRGAFSYDYDVEVVWTNSSDKAVTIPYRIYIKEDPQPGVSWLSTQTIPFDGVAYTGTIKLGPGQSAVVPLEIDLKSEGFMVAGAVGINMKVQKVSPAGQIFDAASTFFVVY